MRLNASVASLLRSIRPRESRWHVVQRVDAACPFDDDDCAGVGVCAFDDAPCAVVWLPLLWLAPEPREGLLCPLARTGEALRRAAIAAVLIRNRQYIVLSPDSVGVGDVVFWRDSDADRAGDARPDGPLT